MTRPRASELKARAQDRLGDILHRLAPGGAHARGHYMVKNPIRNERNASLCVWTQGDACGAWKDFADDAARGDIFGLVAYLNGRAPDDFAFARAWLEDFLGLSTMTEQEREDARQARAQRQAEAEETRRRKAHWAETRAFATWNGGRMVLPGSIAWLYLMHRGIDLRFVETYTGDLRWAQTEYFLGATWEERIERGQPKKFKVKAGPILPAILTPLRDSAGALKGLHYTFLRPDGRGKAEVEKPKLIWPSQAGLVMRLTNGEGNLDPEAADAAGKAGTLILAEGMEDTLSAGLAAPWARCWGAISLGNLGNVPVDRPCVGEILIAAQNDHGNPAAQATLARAEAELARANKPMGRILAPTGKDLNDTVTGKD